MVLIIVGIVLVAVAVGLYFFSARSAQKVFKMKSVQTSKVADIQKMAGSISGEIGAGGFREVVEIKGRALAAQSLISELAKAPCVYYTFKITREYEERYFERDSEGRQVSRTRRASEVVSQNTQAIPFFVQDDSGKIKVELQGAKLTTVKSHSSFEQSPGGTFSGFFSAFSPLAGTITLGYRYEEEIIPIDRDLYILGEASDLTGEITIRKPEKKDELFLVSTKSEEQMIKDAQGAQTGFLIGAIVSAVAGAVSAVIGIFNPNIMR